MQKKVCYRSGGHEAYRVSGNANIDSLKSIGIGVVDDIVDADIVILHDEPWTFPRHFMMNPDIHDKYIIAYTVWETDSLPNTYRYNLELVDEIWTPSSYCAKTLNSHFNNVHVIPHVTEKQPEKAAEIDKMKEMIGYDEGIFYFYSISDIAPNRKNIPSLLKTVPHIMGNRNARYILKTNAPLPPEWPHHRGQMIYLPFNLSRDMIHALHRVGNCYASAHYSEGWGLGMSEAMAYGNLVVATGYGGNMDYMTDANSLPVGYRITPAQMNTPWPSQGQWAAIDQRDFATKLKTAMDNWDDLAVVRRRAEKDMERFSSAAVAQVMKERLQSLQCQRF